MRPIELTYRIQMKHVWRRMAAALMLMVTSVAPAFAQLIQILEPKEGAVSQLRSQGIIAKGMTGFDAELYVNDLFAKREKVRIDGAIEFIGITVPPGDVKLEVRLVNPDGSPFTSEIRRMHVLGNPAAVKIEMEGERLRATGASVMKGKARVVDQWGYPIPDGVALTVLADSGAILSKDWDPTSRGVQIPVRGGEIEFEYQSGKNAGTATVTVQSDNIKASQQIYLDTPLEPFTLVGLVNGTGGLYSQTGDASRTGDNAFLSGFNSEGRIALYARGSIMDDYLLTASFDTDRKNRGRFFRELDPDYLYSMYGDNSLLFYDIQTNRQLFAKIERNQTYAMVGDYNTDSRGQEFAAYNRTLNGVKAGHQDDKWFVSAFGALTDRKVVQVERRGEGLSGFYNLGYTNITPGTEKVRLETRDRYHSEVIVRTENKGRFMDYQIDYEIGTIFFKQPVPSIDQDGNPVYIVIAFEAVSNTPSSIIAGGRIERELLAGLTMGVNGVIEEQQPTNYTLLGTDVKYRLGSLFTVGGELARSNNIGGSGLAYKIETSGSPLEGLSLRSYYRRVEEGFFNITQSGSGRELGTMKYGLGGSYQLFSATRAVVDYYQNKQNLAAGSNLTTSTTAGVEHRFTNQLTGLFRMEALTGENQDTSGVRTMASTIGSGALNYVVNQDLRFRLMHERNLGSTASVVRPNATAVGAEYRVTKDIAVTGEDRFYENGANMAVVGVTSMISEGTQVYGKYEIGNAVAGRRNMASIGIKNSVKLPYDLTMSLSYERAKDLNQNFEQTSTADHSAYSAGLEYLPREPYKASTRVEYGENTRSHKFNFFFGGDYRFRKDLSAILKYTLAKDNAVGAAGFQNIYHLITGVAYRPVESNELNLLGKFEIKGDNNHYLAPYIDYSATIASVHAYLEPVQRFEIGAKYAFKVADEATTVSSFSSTTNFLMLRGTYDLTDDLDVGLEYRALMQAEANDILSGYSAEVGYVFIRNLRLVGGYNFKGYKDRDFVSSEVSSAGPFMRLSFKFGEDLFGY